MNRSMRSKFEPMVTLDIDRLNVEVGALIFPVIVGLPVSAIVSLTVRSFDITGGFVQVIRYLEV